MATTLTARPLPSSSHRLRRGAEVRAVLSRRRAAHGPTVVVHALSRGDGEPPRWTVVAGRKVGDAVHRNRAKRRVRAALDSLDLPAGVDLVVIARGEAVTRPFEALATELAEVAAKAVARSAR